MPLSDGCWNDIAETERASAQAHLEAARGACAAGAKPLGTRQLAKLETAGQQQVAFSLEHDGCVRVLAAGGSGVLELDVELSSVEPAERDEVHGPLAVVGHSGPVCLRAGKHRALVTVRQGRGPVASQAFLMQAPETEAKKE